MKTFKPTLLCALVLLPIAVAAASAQTPDAPRRDTLLLRFWEQARSGARAGIACLEAANDTACTAMAHHFLLADSLAHEVDQPDARHPVLVTDRQIPIRDAGWSLRVMADSVLLTVRSDTDERRVAWWGAQLRNVEVDAGLAKWRLTGVCKPYPAPCNGS